MASVFGIATIKSCTKVDTNKYSINAFDEDYNDTINFNCNKELPINRQIYWEHYYKTNEFHISLL